MPEDDDLAAAFQRHRRELEVLCYRMTGSVTDAEELTQETFLRAWRGRRAFRSSASLRTWLYRIATNTCLDFLARHERRASPHASLTQVLELDGSIDPFPDRYVTSGAPSADPVRALEAKETTELLLMAALLYLPPRQRAAVIARDFLGFSAAEAALLVGTSVPAANSLVQRAREEIRRRYPDGTVRRVSEPVEDDLVRRYVAAHHAGDVEAIVSMLAEEVRVSMPPEAPCIGRASVAAFFRNVIGSQRPGEWRLVPVRANGRPATANYLRSSGEGNYQATSIDVLDVRGDELVAVHCFLGAHAFPAFDLPLQLD